MERAPDMPGTPLMVKPGRNRHRLRIRLNDRMQEWIEAADAYQILQSEFSTGQRTCDIRAWSSGMEAANHSAGKGSSPCCFGVACPEQAQLPANSAALPKAPDRRKVRRSILVQSEFAFIPNSFLFLFQVTGT